MSDSFKVYASKDYVENKIEESRVQPDWNQNDPNAADYVKNRTHYDAKEYSFPVNTSCLSPKITTEVITVQGGSSISSYKYLGRMSLVTPTREEIMLNGMLGGRTSKAALAEEQIVQGAGDGYVIFDADLSQVQVAVAFSATTLRIPRSLGGEYVLEITAPGLYLYGGSRSQVSLSWGGVRPLDEKYIPSTIARKTDLESAGGSGGVFRVTFTPSDDGTFTADKTIDEISEAHNQGMIIEGVVFGDGLSTILQCTSVVPDGLDVPKQVEFFYAQVHGGLGVSLSTLSYHSTNGITFNLREIEAPTT